MNGKFHHHIWLLLLLASGCASTPVALKQADYLDPGFNRAEVDRIYLYPPIDCRVGKKGKKLNLDKVVYYHALNFLEQWNYRVAVTGDKAVSNELGQVPTAEGIAIALPGLNIDSDKRWIMFFALLDSYHKVGFGSTGNAELVGFLYDNKEKKIVWRNKGEGQSGEIWNGLTSLYMAKEHERLAAQKAVAGILEAFPHDPTIPITQFL